MSVDVSRASEKFGEALDILFETRASGVVAVRNLHAASRAALQSEVARLEKRFGANHTKTLRMKSHLAVNKTILRALEVESELVAIRRAPPVEGELLIEGRVADTRGRGIALLTASLVDVKRERIRAVKPSTTQKSGYFAIPVNEDLGKRLVEAHPDGVYLGVFTERGAILHVGDEPLPLKLGQVPFLQVTLEPDDFRPVRPRGGGPAGPARSGQGPVTGRESPAPTKRRRGRLT